jgi:hypothetical protein
MKPPLLLYSASTWFAYSVAERFYGGVHYAWCSPVYDGRSAADHVNIPPSASPAALYRAMLEDTRRGDRHSSAIDQNKNGIYRGARARRSQGLIGDAEVEEIRSSLERAECRDFRPVLYIIPYDQVKESVVRVAVDERAHPMSVEYRIEMLPRASFDMVELTL